jgi:hypothetical protein
MLPGDIPVEPDPVCTPVTEAPVVEDFAVVDPTAASLGKEATKMFLVELIKFSLTCNRHKAAIVPKLKSTQIQVLNYLEGMYPWRNLSRSSLGVEKLGSQKGVSIKDFFDLLNIDTIINRKRRCALGRFLILVLVSALGFTSTSLAGLGDRAESISTDSSRMVARRMNADVFRKYSVQTLETDATTLKEYVNSEGLIFAVTWQGLDHPDLSVILGSYYPGYQKADAETPAHRGLRQRNLQKENLVVQKWGQMRNLQGRAYDPSLLPSGVTLNEIK